MLSPWVGLLVLPHALIVFNCHLIWQFCAFFIKVVNLGLFEGYPVFDICNAIPGISCTHHKVSPGAKFKQNPSQTLLNEVVRHKGTPCDAYAKQFESNYAALLDIYRLLRGKN